MTSINYNEFQAGQGVSAPALNENFSLTNNAIENLEVVVNSAVSSLTSTTNLKADRNGSSAENFNVANGTESSHAVNFSQLQKAAMPIGSLIWFAGSSAPDGYLVCDGSEISRTTYAELFAIIGIKYGGGDGSATFNLPLLTDNRFVEGALDVATSKEAGLPNITGAFTSVQYDASGAFAITALDGRNNYGTSTGGVARYSLDASRSSDIYGKSTTVQPKSLTMLPCIKF